MKLLPNTGEISMHYILSHCVPSGGSTVSVYGANLHSTQQPQMVLSHEGKVIKVVSSACCRLLGTQCRSVDNVHVMRCIISLSLLHLPLAVTIIEVVFWKIITCVLMVE